MGSTYYEKLLASAAALESLAPALGTTARGLVGVEVQGDDGRNVERTPAGLAGRETEASARVMPPPLDATPLEGMRETRCSSH